jgi:uncharacterized membrane protein
MDQRLQSLLRIDEGGPVQMNVGKWERIGSLAAGVALLYVASRRTRLSGLARGAGAGLMVRGFSGFCPVNAAIGRNSLSRAASGDPRRDTRQALRGSRGVHVLETVVVGADPATVYRFWRNLSNLPQFMRHLERVDVIDSTRSHWVSAAPAGTSVEWDAEIINDVENKLIAWKSLENAEVVSAGSVRFRPTMGGTEITVHLQYDPPAGKLGAWIAAMFGREPSQMIREDLRRLKLNFEMPAEV